MLTLMFWIVGPFSDAWEHLRRHNWTTVRTTNTDNRDKELLRKAACACARKDTSETKNGIELTEHKTWANRTLRRLKYIYEK
jgi:hypothetical protein